VQGAAAEASAHFSKSRCACKHQATAPARTSVLDGVVLLRQVGVVCQERPLRGAQAASAGRRGAHMHAQGRKRA